MLRWGVGPGNFRAAYLPYKLPESSEEILDPHNLFLEVWATAGFWAFVALVLALILGLRNLLGARSARTSASVEDQPMDREERSGPPTDPASHDDQEGGPPREQSLAGRIGRGWLGAGRRPRDDEPVRERHVSAMADPRRELAGRGAARCPALATAADPGDGDGRGRWRRSRSTCWRRGESASRRSRWGCGRPWPSA